MKHASQMQNRIPAAMSFALFVLIVAWAGCAAWAAQDETLIIYDTSSSGAQMEPIKGHTPDKANASGGRWACSRPPRMAGVATWVFAPGDH